MSIDEILTCSVKLHLLLIFLDFPFGVQDVL